MRVLLVQPGSDRRGHFGIYTVNQCQAIAKQGHEVTLWTNKVKPEKFLREPVLFRIVEAGNGKLTFDGCYEGSKLRLSRYAWMYLRNSYAVLDSALSAARTEHFDVIHVTGAEFTIASLVLKKHSKHIPPVVMEVSAANFSFASYSGPVPLRAYKVLQREIFKSTLGKELKAITVLGEFHKTVLRKQLRLPEEFPIIVIPDSSAVSECQLNVKEARRRLGLGDYDGALFLFFGLIRKDKGIEDLFKAVALLNGRDFKLVMAGAPYDYSEKQINGMISANHIEGKMVPRLGYVPDDEVPVYFSAADALVLPYARIYTGGSGPLQKGAGIHGRPAIVTDVSEMGDVVKKFQMGLVAEPGNPKSLADTMREFLEISPGDRQRMAANALAFAKGNSWETMAAKLTDLYQLAMK